MDHLLHCIKEYYLFLIIVVDVISAGIIFTSVNKFAETWVEVELETESEQNHLYRGMSRYHRSYVPILSRPSGLTHRRRGSSKWHRERGGGIYTSGTAVCAAQMGVNLRQSSGTVPLWAPAACTIFLSDTGAMTNQSGDFIYLG